VSFISVEWEKESCCKCTFPPGENLFTVGAQKRHSGTALASAVGRRQVSEPACRRGIQQPLRHEPPHDIAVSKRAILLTQATEAHGVLRVSRNGDIHRFQQFSASLFLEDGG